MKYLVRLRSDVCLLAIGLVFALSACDRKQGEAEANAPDTLQKPTHRSAAPAFKASEDDCVGPLVKSGRPKDLSFGAWKFRLDGYLLTQLDQHPNEDITVGILSDTKENTEANRENLKEILAFFKREKAEAILHLGDIATTTPLPEIIDVPDRDAAGNPLSAEQKRLIRQREISKARRESMKKSYDDIIAMIAVLAETPEQLPVFVLSGNRECKSTFNTALDTLSEDYPNVFNLNMIRRVDLDDLDIISMPGYHDPDYVHCTWDKCVYYESDTLSLIDLANEANSETLLVSHGPPRQEHSNGIDVHSEGANVGNPMLTQAIAKANLFFGAFGNIQEAGGKATNLQGTTLLPQDSLVSSLFINPGPADSMIWSMNDGTQSKGMAAVVHFVGKKAKYKIFRVGEKATKAAPSGQ